MVWSLGFNTGLGVTYRLELLDGDHQKIEYIDPTPERRTVGGRFKPGDLNLGRALKPDNIPTKVKWGGPKRLGIPDALSGVSMNFVNDNFRRIIESFEPEVHQFFPIEILWNNGELGARMFFLNVCNRLDTLDRLKSTAKISDAGMRKPETGSMVFSGSRIGGHHIWHDKHIYKGLYVSDILHDALIAANITGIEFSRRDSTKDVLNC